MTVSVTLFMCAAGDYYLRLLLEEDDTDENNAEYSAIKKSYVTFIPLTLSFTPHSLLSVHVASIAHSPAR